MNGEEHLEVLLEVPSDSRFVGVVRATVGASMGESVDAEDRLELSAAVSEACALVRYHSPEAGRIALSIVLAVTGARVSVSGAASGGSDEEFAEERDFATAILSSIVDSFDITRGADSVQVTFSKALPGV